MYNHILEYLRFVRNSLSNFLILILELQFLSPHVIPKTTKLRRLVFLACYQHASVSYTILIVPWSVFQGPFGGCAGLFVKFVGHSPSHAVMVQHKLNHAKIKFNYYYPIKPIFSPKLRPEFLLLALPALLGGL
jgi:hypothetical protein